MNFNTWSPAVFWAGAALLALLLALLQRLRVRHRMLVLPAASLWRAVLHAAPPRELHRRLSRWPAYLLVLAIALLLWLAAARPELGDDGRHHVVYLDNSVLMGVGPAWPVALRALRAELQALPGAHREVVLGAPVPARLLAPGEDTALLEARLAGVRVQPQPAAVAAWAAGLPARIDGRLLVLHYHGSAAGAAALAATLPAGVERQGGSVAPAVPNNRGIVALGIQPARSGRWDRVDLLVGTAAAQGPAPAWDELVWQRNGQPLTAPPALPQRASPASWWLEDLPADGSRLHVALRRGDGFAADDGASVQLPRRQRLRVALGAGLPPALQAVLAHDPALQLVAADDAAADVQVRSAGSAPRPGLPALVLQPAAAGGAAVQIGDPQAGAGADLAARLAELGLADWDAAASAQALRREVGLALRTEVQRRVTVWAELMAPGQGWVGTAAMPLFVSRSLHWLAGGDAPAAQLPAPPGLATTQAAAQAAPAPAPVARTGRDLLFLLLLAGAALLLLLEWQLFQRGRLP